MTIDSFTKALDAMIISASGWRGVFAAAGGEESANPAIPEEHALIAALAARVFAAYIKRTRGDARPVIIAGMDARPTGPAILETVIAALKNENCVVRRCGVIAAPEIMAYARNLGAALPCAFIYISASHNPIGHNGIKFGLCDGGVLPPDEAAVLIRDFREAVKTLSVKDVDAYAAAASTAAAGGGGGDSAAAAVSAGSGNPVAGGGGGGPAAGVSAGGGGPAAGGRYKEEARAAYAAFTNEIITGEAEPAAQDAVLSRLREAFMQKPLGIAADFNGSARAASIDEQYLRGLGLRFYAINEKPGAIAHRIVPEGESLVPCRLLLEKLHREDPAFLLGYVPDCDGDRGNLVIWDEEENARNAAGMGGAAAAIAAAVAGTARALEAQEVFALAVLAELRFLKTRGADMGKVAVVVNDPTSMRVDELAAGLGARVFRAEVGEANAVSLARKLAAEGWLVRPLGEGAAGGVIIHPSSVRDPLDTLGALLKLLALPGGGGAAAGAGGAAGGAGGAGGGRPVSNAALLKEALAAIPRWTTTGAYSPQAVLKVKTANHAALKERCQPVFLRGWEARKPALQKHGIYQWRAFRYNGIQERQTSAFGEAGNGGLKIVFYGEDGVSPNAAIWMRGSGTEPVFRVMADIKGRDAAFEAELLAWQREIVTAADAAADAATAAVTTCP